MRAWLLAILIIILISGSAMLYMLYANAKNPLHDRQQEVESIALEETDAVEIREVDYYHGTRSFQVMDAVDEEGEEMYVWVEEQEAEEDIEEDLDLTDENENEENEEENNEEENEDEERLIMQRYQTDGVTKEDVAGLAQGELDMERLKSVRLGAIEETPIYEINYIDDSGRQSYYYVTFEDASYIRHYQFSS